MTDALAEAAEVISVAGWLIEVAGAGYALYAPQPYRAMMSTQPPSPAGPEISGSSVPVVR